MNETPNPRRQWLRFRLRALLFVIALRHCSSSLLFVIALLAIPLAWVAKERRISEREMQVAEQLQNLGIIVGFGGPFDITSKPRDDVHRRPWRANAEKVLGTRVLGVSTHGSDLQDLTLLDGLTSLRGVSLSYGHVSDLTPIAGLKTLRTAFLIQVPISDLAPLARLTNLELLDIEGTRVHDLTPLIRLENLAYLNLSHTHVSDFTPLANLKGLRYLFLNGNQVSDLAPFSRLKHLQKLHFKSTQVKDLSPLIELTELTYITATDSLVTKEQVETLQKALPNCKIEHDPFP